MGIIRYFECFQEKHNGFVRSLLDEQCAMTEQLVRRSSVRVHQVAHALQQVSQYENRRIGDPVIVFIAATVDADSLHESAAAAARAELR